MIWPTKIVCDGRCGPFGACEGAIQTVTVWSPDGRRNWGTYRYCERAIKEDIENGYVVRDREMKILNPERDCDYNEGLNTAIRLAKEVCRNCECYDTLICGLESSKK